MIGPGVGLTWDSSVEASAQTITVDGIAALTTAGLTVQNTTPALVGAQVQRAPSVWQYGTGWDVDDAVSRVFGMGWQMRPVAGNTVTGAMHLMRDLAGTVADVGVTITSDAAIAFGATPALSGTLRFTDGQELAWRSGGADITGFFFSAASGFGIGNGSTHGSISLTTTTSEIRAVGGTDRLRWNTTGLALYGNTPVAQATDVGAAPTDTVANLAAWCELVRTRIRNIGITA